MPQKMDVLITPATSVRGTLTLPADKAICHRAALVCAIAKGSTELRPWSPSEDCQRTLDVLTGLGVSLTQTPSGIRLDGVGRAGLRAPAGPLGCGESGTTIRLACGVLAGQPFRSELTASGSLRERPMRRIIEPLTHMGASIDGAPQSSGEVCPPLVIEGRRPLRGLTYTMPIASAQVKSAVLLAGLFADGPTTVVEPSSTRDHTERLLHHLGAAVRRQNRAITVEPLTSDFVSPGVLRLPSDLSSAAFFIVAALLVPGSEIVIPNVGLNPSRTRFLDALKRMGANIDWSIEEGGWEPRGTVTAKSSALRGTRITTGEAAMMIDELPILMVAACAAEGETSFEGIQELTVKESDRLHAMTAGLETLGANPDVIGQRIMKVRKRALRGATVDSAGDHRIAMSLAIAGLIAEGQTRIRGADCVAKSLGSFFELLASVAGIVPVTFLNGDRHLRWQRQALPPRD